LPFIAFNGSLFYIGQCPEFSVDSKPNFYTEHNSVLLIFDSQVTNLLIFRILQRNWHITIVSSSYRI